MKFTSIGEEDLYRLVELVFNPPSIGNSAEEHQFQEEIRGCYGQLLETLSELGKEGDHYGVSDFSMRPDLLDRPTVKAPPAPHVREFAITVLSEDFFRTSFLAALHHFLSTEARNYRVVVSQDFDPDCHLKIFLTSDLAQVFCTDPNVESEIQGVLNKL